MISQGAQYWIDKLRLEPHPEGGYYRQTYRSELILSEAALAPEFPGSRAASTAIYFLLAGEDFSAFHRLRSDEMWHFYTGGSLVVHVINHEAREYSKIVLGSDAEAGEVFQTVVKAGCWFASQLRERNSFALVGCTVSPGFDFDDFELARRTELTQQFPQHRDLIEKLTRP